MHHYDQRAIYNCSSFLLSSSCFKCNITNHCYYHDQHMITIMIIITTRSLKWNAPVWQRSNVQLFSLKNVQTGIFHCHHHHQSGRSFQNDSLATISKYQFMSSLQFLIRFICSRSVSRCLSIPLVTSDQQCQNETTNRCFSYHQKW